MPRLLRVDVGDVVYHVINRSNGRAKIFHSDTDYSDFEFLLLEMKVTFDMRILAYTVMPNHWHMLLYPRNDKDLSKALHWLGTSHARRHHQRKGTIGGGHLYQGRFKSFPIKDDKHLLTVLKYIERNPVRAKIVKKPDEWQWGSAFRRMKGTSQQQKILSELPVEMPKNYYAWICQAEPSEDLDKLRHSVNKGVSYG